ncbi:MAG: hypothetical protein IKS20_15440 [Victivallales bacterium]|nr:hypothetical protein [Victivallales bacterium]
MESKKTISGACRKGVLLLTFWLFCCLAASAEVIRYPGNTGNRHTAAKASEWNYSEWPYSKTAKDAEKLPSRKGDRAILDMAYYGNGIADGKVAFYGEDGKKIDRQEALSFSAWGKELLSVSSVVVEIKDGANADEMVKRGFKEAFKLREYKNSLLSNQEGRWHIKGNENVRFYVVERYSYDRADVYAVDVKGIFSYSPKTPLVMMEISGMRPEPMNRKELCADAVDVCIRDVWNDRDFADMTRKAHNAANNFSNPDYFGKSRPRNTGGEVPSSAVSSGNDKQSVLSKLDLNDDNYDWCKCNPPGCVETDMKVSFRCSNCMKVNREYARKALQLEQRAKKQGEKVMWIGEGAESKARKAAGGK